MSRDKKADKAKGIRMICETAKSKGETLRITPYFVLELMDEAAAEKERADRLEEFWKDVAAEQAQLYLDSSEREQKLREALEYEIELHVLNGSGGRERELRELLASLYPKEETK